MGPGEGTASCAILFQDACFSWSADSSVMAVGTQNGGMEACSGAVPCRDVTFCSACRWWQGDMVLMDLCLSIPSGSLVAIVGDVGAGENFCALHECELLSCHPFTNPERLFKPRF